MGGVNLPNKQNIARELKHFAEVKYEAKSKINSFNRMFNEGSIKLIYSNNGKVVKVFCLKTSTKK